MLIDEIDERIPLSLEMLKEKERWIKAAQKYFSEYDTILAIEYFDNSGISDGILKKHNLSNDAYFLSAYSDNRNEHGEDLNIKHVWVDRYEFKYSVKE